MWYAPEKYKIKFPVENLNEEFLKIKGELPDKEAKITLAKFLNHNLGLTTELVSGIDLAPFQEATLRGLMNRNFSMCVWGRGCGKTFIASVFCFLQCMFNPGTKILVAGPTFRTARFIFNNLEKMVQTKGAELLAQCFGAKIKRNDQYEWSINGGTITAIPLNGEKIRGFRANVLLLDEFLLLPEDLIQTVLMPFLVAPQDMAERIKIRAAEDKLIEEGHMKEDERMEFENNTKMIALSSASYTFENLYRTYNDWMNKIYNKDDASDASYFISHLGYEALPEHMIDRTIIEEAAEGGQSHSSFQREYCAIFTDGSDSYFSAKKMHECTIPDGKDPSTLIKGEEGAKYILGIDPSFSNSPSSDYFAMCVLEIDEENGHAYMVHNYAVAGGNLKDHIRYFYYLVKNFDFEMICIDNAGYQFIDSCNEAKWQLNDKINFKFVEHFTSEKEGLDHEKQMKDLKKQYNKERGRIVFKQNFSTDFIRKSNEHLQACIDHKRIWFASKTCANGSAFDKTVNQNIGALINTNYKTLLELIEEQDNLIHQVKKQCALVEVTTTPRGHQTFDLPQHLKRSTSANRARKDNYTALLLANWALKCYFDMKALPEQDNFTFVPRMLG